MIPLNEISLAAWSSVLGIVATAILGYKILRRYYAYHTELSKYFGWFFLLTAASFACVGWIDFVASPSFEMVRWAYLTSEAFFYVSLLPQARVLWFVSGATNKLYYRLLMVGVGVAALISWYLEFLLVKFDVSKHPVGIEFSPLVLLIVSALYILLMYPAGYFFVRQGLRLPTFKERFKSISIGSAYIIVSTVGIYNSIFNGGQSGTISVYIYAVTAIVLIVALLLPSKDGV